MVSLSFSGVYCIFIVNSKEVPFQMVCFLFLSNGSLTSQKIKGSKYLTTLIDYNFMCGLIRSILYAYNIYTYMYLVKY